MHCMEKSKMIIASSLSTLIKLSTNDLWMRLRARIASIVVRDRITMPMGSQLSGRGPLTTLI